MSGRGSHTEPYADGSAFRSELPSSAVVLAKLFNAGWQGW
jgi:hypothetical protein